jgi:hypothetical protein
MKTMQFYEPPYTVIRAQNERIETLLDMVETQSREVERAVHLAAALEAELKSHQISEQRFRALEEKRTRLDAAVEATENGMARVECVAKRLADEISEAQASRFLRWMRRMRPGADWRDRLGTEFQQLFDDTVIFGKDTGGLVLRPSSFLSEVPFLPYTMALDRPGWCGVTIAPLLDSIEGAGEIACEIVSPRGEIIRHVRLPVRELRDLQPLRFSFDPIADSHLGSFEMRIAVSGPLMRVRILEWRRPVFAGLRPAPRRPFVAIHFQ